MSKLKYWNGTSWIPLDAQSPATLIVAAANSKYKGRADYVCDGVSDQTEINAALTALGAVGGKVVLLEGTFSVTGSINVPSNCSVEGQGNGTVLTIPANNNGSFNIIQNSDQTNGNSGIRISNFKIDGNKANNTAGTQRGIYLNKATYSTIEKMSVVNLRNDGMFLTGASYNILSLNTCQSNGSNGITLAIASNNKVIGNILQSNSIRGISLGSSDFNTIIANTCQGNNQHGIFINGSSNNVVSSNGCLENGQSATATYDNIHIEIGSNYNNVQGNSCRQGALTNKPRYGIRVESSDCNGNLVTNNDLYTGGATGAFSDVGTGTVTTAGNKLA